MISVEESPAGWSLPALRYYWGVILAQISEQARVSGARYTPEAWHIHFAEVFLGWEFQTVAGGKVRRTRRSTAKLTSSERADYLLQVQAYAVTDLGVVFDDDEEGFPDEENGPAAQDATEGEACCDGCGADSEGSHAAFESSVDDCPGQDGDGS
ncbi:hypothetical protein [Ideonella livida]|uniref:Uncharacterized protein n=1 Tax=Ideonella livida TaxID=2707176 RepID=A0A7C9PER3_9BURK|nr:hypothetical protein [Ideonella livida]NDY89751.1 hypothetical protein [Ideonella livida]